MICQLSIYYIKINGGTMANLTKALTVTDSNNTDGALTW